MTGLAFVGAGTVAELYAKAVERGVAATFRGVVDPDAGAADALAARLGGRRYDTLEALLADPGVDAVVVMSPTATHADIAGRCLSAGKHVLVEKPVSHTRAEIDHLARLAEAAGRVCMPAHNYIYNAGMERARQLVAEGRIGTLASVWLLYNVFHDEATAARYGGVLRAVAIHHAYTLLYLCGRPVRVMAVRSRVHYDALPDEDQALIVCEMPGGALANLWVSFAASDRTGDPWTVVCKVMGTKGTAKVTWSDAAVDDDGGPAWGIPSYVDSFRAELRFFLERAVGAGEPPLSSLADARDALAILEAAERSIQAGGAFQPVLYSGA
ncbi:MAG TPA: Gfo/Idh/MocA family oxidoreductase [Azospirillaceae bacterium]|nr:Gfo/Idh/MocA family oxidoreductase [Azospirillaceae bacterium]